MPGEILRPTRTRLTNARTRLAKATNLNEAMVALSEADLGTLREMESDFYHHPGPTGSLRQRIAKAHMRVVRQWKGRLRDTGNVTTALVTEWVRATLAEWLPGYTDLTDAGQFRIRFLDDNVIEVVTVQGLAPRQFRIAVSVKEVQV